MHFLARRLEAFNRDELPDWRQSPSLLWRALLFAPRLIEYFLFYLLAFGALMAAIVFMVAAWIVGLDRKSN
ncbi:hypothetical protein [Sinorhizobium alkalisoli]|uniref:Uncharacterized protein n=1 Tax=Sinorhizobium alkalisoli TaxID=1752398 RepID=A0A1E3V9M9_9HYPH|nr:hypothetical protein [Sinorhizobium alkalisoli]MCA1490464.1 hypothetical protein [Ensifer sp. NBAIM29]MCG5478972.1 hypothetical protein [Sinorhizobium alkalisoli]ODR89546.1 hypothetical protein A8M32_19675 [Sinorhizobium alkalisoli]QFI69794.1 hypothetical protein EKH55_4920 [Sinorhizobium alkalisoli]